jgi:hypothetical protein
MDDLTVSVKLSAVQNRSALPEIEGYALHGACKRYAMPPIMQEGPRLVVDSENPSWAALPFPRAFL